MKKVRVLLLSLLCAGSMLYSQGIIPPSCGMEGITGSSSPKSSCEMDGDGIIDQHKETIIPYNGPPITLPVKFVIVQDLNGNNNFDLNDQDQLDFLNNVIDKMNDRMKDLVEEDCDCTVLPIHYEDSQITYDIDIIEMQSAIWDHYIHDTTPVGSPGGKDLRCPIDATHYVARLNSEYLLHPEYSEAITFFFTHATESHHYDGLWYSGFRCEDNPSHPALIHAPDAYLNYEYLDNGGGEPYQTIAWLENFYARTAAHEIFHQYQTNVNHKDQCEFNLMNAKSNVGPAPDPQNPNTALTGCQLREAFGTMMAYHMAKYVPCIESYEEEVEVTTNEIWDTETKIFSDIRIKAGASLTIECEIEMQKNGKIIVESSGKLILDEGTLTGCEDRWDGIFVEGGNPDFDVKFIGGEIKKGNLFIALLYLYGEICITYNSFFFCSSYVSRTGNVFKNL